MHATDTISVRYDSYLHKDVEVATSQIKQSTVNDKVYYFTEFVITSYMGNESSVEKEFKIGQNEDGYHGFYRAYIVIPSYWKFSSLSPFQECRAVDFYGDKVTYKKVELPDGTTMEKRNCIGWSYDHGLPDENLIGRRTVLKDIRDAIEDIVEWEWENEPDMMVKSLVNEGYELMKRLRRAYADGTYEVISDESLEALGEFEKELDRFIYPGGY